MSVASAGVKLAERIFGKLGERKALVLGAGAISEQVVSQLHDRGIASLYVMNRSRDRAEELARQYGGKVIGWGEWDAALRMPDVVVSSVATEEPILGREIVERAMEARENRALFLMDLGMPRNIGADVAKLYNVYVYTMDDLSDIVQQNRQARENEIPRAENIVETHVGKFLSWQASVELVSLVDELLEKLLLEPAKKLRGEKELRRKIQNVEALRDLFLPKREKP